MSKLSISSRLPDENILINKESILKCVINAKPLSIYKPIDLIN